MENTETPKTIEFKTDDKDLASMIIAHYSGKLFPNEQYRIDQAHEKAQKIYCFTGLEEEKIKKFLDDYQEKNSMADDVLNLGYPLSRQYIWFMESIVEEDPMFREIFELKNISKNNNKSCLTHG